MRMLAPLASNLAVLVTVCRGAFAVSDLDFSTVPRLRIAEPRSVKLDCSDQKNYKCLAYGMDIQNGGEYFQSSNSKGRFTFVQQFEGCEDDMNYNILVDPSGEEYICTNTSMQPDGMNKQSTCPIWKSRLTSGTWSIIVISNNGDACPVAFERDFELKVEPQFTSTYIPTVTLWASKTPVVTKTVYRTTKSTFTPFPPFVKNPFSIAGHKIVTVTPEAVTTTATRTIANMESTSFNLVIIQETRTETAKCILPTRPNMPDPFCRTIPTIFPAAKLFAGGVPPWMIGPGKVGGMHNFRDVPLDRSQRIRERKERLAKLGRRALGPHRHCFTETNTAKWKTRISTSTVAISTVISTSTVSVVITATPPPFAAVHGQHMDFPFTVTAPTPTKTVKKNMIATKISTSNITTTFILTTTIYPSNARRNCAASGGVLA